MEKQRMDRGKYLYRAGLLIFLPALFFITGFLFAQNGDEAGAEDPVMVRTELSAVSAMVGSPWSVFVLVNHPNPREVTVRSPRFPTALVLDRVRTETRFIRRVQAPREQVPKEAAPGENVSDAEAVQGDRWTRVEFLFTPVRAGTVSLQPFEITVLGRQYETAVITVRIREATVRRSYDPRFRWQGQAPSALTGERAELFLELTNWDPSKNAPQGLFQGRAPRNAILEESPPLETGAGTYRYGVSVIPLDGNNVALESFIFRSDVYAITVPAINIPVSPTVPNVTLTTSSTVENPTDENTSATPSNIAIPFPENYEKSVPFFDREYKRICARVRELWEKDLKAEALAEIRRNERDSLAGPNLASLRVEMEQALGLGFTEDEKWSPLGISTLSWVVVGILIISTVLILLFFRPGFHRNSVSQNAVSRKNVTIRRLSGLKFVVGLAFLLGLALIFLEEGIGNLPIGRPRSLGKTAVLMETQAYRVPDTKGAVNARFSEGQPVIIDDNSLDWCSVESHDGRYGWVKRETVITY